MLANTSSAALRADALCDFDTASSASSCASCAYRSAGCSLPSFNARRACVEVLLRALQLHGTLLRVADGLLRLLHRGFAAGNALFREIGNAAATREQPGCER